MPAAYQDTTATAMSTCSFDSALDTPAPHKGSYVKWYAGCLERLQPCIERSSACFKRLSACFTRCTSWFSVRWLAIVLGACTLALSLTWWILVPFFVDTESMSSKYKFSPLDFGAYSKWKTTLRVFTILLLGWVWCTCAFDTNRGKRWWLYIPIVIFSLLVLIGNVIVKHETQNRQAFEQGFAVQFNTYYCNTRTVRVCLEGSESEVLVLTRGSNATVTESENATDAAFEIWARCRKAVHTFDALAFSRESEAVGAIKDMKIYDFLADATGSSATDAWCGDLAHRTTTPTDDEQRAHPAPYAANTAMFRKYTREWARSIVYSNVVLGSMIGCMVMITLLLRIDDKKA